MANLTLPASIDPGTPIVATELQQNFTALRDAVNSLDDVNLSAALAALLGISITGVKHRGYSAVSAAEARTNTNYGLLTTPDRVTNIAVPTSGLIFVAYQALWKESVANTARATIMLNSTQVQRAEYTGAPLEQHASRSSGVPANIYTPLTSAPSGLVTNPDTAQLDALPAVSTGQIIGFNPLNSGNPNQDTAGVTTIFASPGTYDVSVQFKSISGQVTVKDRQLWVWTMGF